MSHRFGPDNATLTVRTTRTGAASKAGHDLLIEVTSWSATLEPDADPALTLTADSRSLRVLEGTGGIQALGDDDKAGIEKTIDDEVLEGTAIEFRSTKVELGADGNPETVEGELRLAGERHPVRFELAVAVDGLRVESALHPRRKGARAMGVQGKVGDRLGLCAIARGHERAVLPGQA